MEPFSPAQEPDEGYSEHPLNSAASGSLQDTTTTLALRSSGELSTWLAAQMPTLTIQEKKHLAMLILNELPTTVIADIVMTQLNPRLYINFVHYLPPEICLKILGYLDAESLICVALCCRGWYDLASDRKLWEKLYYLEGWMAVLPEVARAEKRMNESSVASQMDARRVRKGDEDDYEMVDADIAMGHEHKDILMSVLCLQFDSDPEEDLIVSGSSDSDVILWRFSTGEILQRLKRAHRESVLNVKFDKRILVTCSKDKTIKIFNRQPLRPGDLGYADPQTVSPVPVNLRNYGYDDSPLNQLAVTPPYTMIASLEGHNAAVNAVQICDREIVSASGDRNIRLWDWPNQIVKRTFIGHNKGIACVQYDGRRIVSGSSDNEVKVFDSESSLEVASLRAHSNLVRTVQAGFGDLPYSREEDQLEAKAVKKAYFEALDAGIIDESRPTGRRAYNNTNTGSRRPEDIIGPSSFGAEIGRAFGKAHMFFDRKKGPRRL
ncbi:hypothetical protein ONZ43_g5606 [Nemania bipapillata]|uniref:Uncharacterized protein n=1 Tax=Nemania bipapillata TaxID=110536 RepID=A0ACC2I8K9_9PEZI|nr:hypothetical protein ONZ43_g5606 [Nemania bipapillata]